MINWSLMIIIVICLGSGSDLLDTETAIKRLL
jgi:hypothetical protein